MSSDTLIDFLTLGVANSSRIWVSGTCCLFSRNLHSLRFYLTEINESTTSFYKYNALGENTAANQTDKVSGGPGTQDSAWQTVGTK